jgi:hypothetical protein
VKVPDRTKSRHPFPVQSRLASSSDLCIPADRTKPPPIEPSQSITYCCTGTVGETKKGFTNAPSAGKLVAAPGFTNAATTCKSMFDCGCALNGSTSASLVDDCALGVDTRRAAKCWLQIDGKPREFAGGWN